MAKGSNIATIVSFLRNKGLSDIAIAGILGNWRVESGFSPSAYNSKEGAVGLAQWEGGRRTELQNYAAAHGTSETDLNTQLNFFWHELISSYGGAYNAIQTAQSASQAAAIFDEHYEESSGSTRADRIASADAFYGSGLKSDGGADFVGNGAGLSGGSGSGVDGADAKLTKADYETVDSLGSLLAEIPELGKLLNEATSKGWSLTTFQNAVENSKWFKNHADTARAAIAMKANDPATWAQKLNNATNSIRHLADQLGMALTPAEERAIATNALFTGNDTDQQWLTDEISHHENYSKLKDVDSLGGQMGATTSQLQSLAADYGYTWTAPQLAEKAQRIVDGTTTIDTYANNLKSWAKSAFPGLSEQIDAGQTIKDLADPYVQSMSQLLEVDPSTINTYTPMIRKALQGSYDPTAKAVVPTTLYNFEKQVRSDPRWQYTQNAKDTVASALVKIGADFGFGPDA